MYVTLKACGWNGFFARPGDTFAAAEDMTDKDGRPLPAAVVARFLATENMAEQPPPAPAPEVEG